jgi:hypothetical protein
VPRPREGDESLQGFQRSRRTHVQYNVNIN